MKVDIKSKLDYHLGVIESLRNTSKEDFLQIAKYELEQYAKRKVIEELEEWCNYMENDCSVYRNQDLLKEFANRIKELKQER